MGTRTDQLRLAPIPLGQHLRARRAPENARMDEPRKAHAGDMARGAEDALEVPDRFRRVRVDLVEEAAAVAGVEDTREAPGLRLQWLHVLDFDEEHVARFGVFDLEGPAEVDIFDVVGGVGVFDLAAGPVDAFDFDDFVVFDGASEGDCGERWVRLGISRVCWGRTHCLDASDSVENFRRLAVFECRLNLREVEVDPRRISDLLLAHCEAISLSMENEAGLVLYDLE
ncbi:MAG: hypothetical protein Q9157_008558 [Trypethelium eluteriae]